MKFYLFPFLLIFLVCVVQAQMGTAFISSEIKDKVKNLLIAKFPQEKERIIKGVDQVASFWQEKDGSANAFEKFCEDNFIGDIEKLNLYFEKISNNFEVINGHFNKMILDLKRPLDEDRGEILPIDQLFGSYNPSAHLSDDLFENKIAFVVLLNFPYYTLDEKIALAPKWSRKDWAYARMGDAFISRVPADIYQEISKTFVDADTYISEYNIYMGNLIDKDKKTYFPKDLKLISHWGLRDELKAHYSDPKGVIKQRIIYNVMLRIIEQTIPNKVVNSNEYNWDPINNKLYKDNKEIKFEPEDNTRYQHLLSVFNVMKKLDSYYPKNPTHISRKFEIDRELPEAMVEKLFVDYISSPQVKRTAKLISKRLGRNLEPYDIWYDGFKSRSSINESELDKIVSEKYPDIKAFEKDIKNILIKLGFTVEKAEFIASKIEVDPARGAGHAWGADMKSEKAHLRTRVPKGGMNYKGFNIAMHELGHCVEQTITLQNIDYWMLKGVPNTAFTEAFAFVFQGKDLDILGIKNEDQNKKYYDVLDNLWSSYEIMGVSLVDMKVWNWMYKNPNATKSELKEAVIRIAKDIWNKYYADVFGVKDSPILAIYSHMIDAALYLPDYPLGHLIDFQIQKYLEGKNLGAEMERMCIAGKILPNEWMKNAVGNEISIKPIMEAADEALNHIK
ncbi:MAG TPA: hypothetical protein PKW14_01460 [Bacteroidota bacterium]|jgi:hypothetical protein|nr:hypothetical protein [Bacteroidota bacterium]